MRTEEKTILEGQRGKKNHSLKEHVQKLEAQFSQTEKDLTDLEQYGRHECLN